VVEWVSLPRSLGTHSYVDYQCETLLQISTRNFLGKNVYIVRIILHYFTKRVRDLFDDIGNSGRISRLRINGGQFLLVMLRDALIHNVSRAPKYLQGIGY
jgi:hypothetical protein